MHEQNGLQAERQNDLHRVRKQNFEKELKSEELGVYQKLYSAVQHLSGNLNISLQIKQFCALGAIAAARSPERRLLEVFNELSTDVCVRGRFSFASRIRDTILKKLESEKLSPFSELALPKMNLDGNIKAA